ncbi:MAG: NUDIX domain-containing protein [Candidatus Paceibacterota bacterium]|jgi:8-oxo-dGTP pyrophosphatase MutT (NUDIX family)
MLYDQISQILDKSICDSESTYENYLKRLGKGAFTRDENPQSHFCTYFFPHNVENKKVFIVHHRKANLWVSPGGHIDKGEGILETLNREINEELGVENFFKETPMPFLFTITLIENRIRSCKTHFDIWYLMNTDGSNFNVDPKEFYDTKWLTIPEAEEIVTDKPNLTALGIIKKYN